MAYLHVIDLEQHGNDPLQISYSLFGTSQQLRGIGELLAKPLCVDLSNTLVDDNPWILKAQSLSPPRGTDVNRCEPEAKLSMLTDINVDKLCVVLRIPGVSGVTNEECVR